MSDKASERLVRFSESFFERYGDCYLGVGWTKRQEDADTRYRVMLDLIAGDDRPATLLDFGCGASHLYEYLRRRHQRADISLQWPRLVAPVPGACSRGKFPHVTYYELDILEDDRLPNSTMW